MPARKRNGFTLIELIVVIAIIAILSSIGMVMYTGAQKSARDAKRMGDIDEIKKALEQYYVAHHAYLNPTSCDDTGCVIPPAAGTTFNDLVSYFANNAIPTDPGPTTYQYFTDNISCSSPKYVLCATLENSSQGNTALPLPGTGSTFNCATFTAGKGAYCVKSNF
jgi:prepilin-type N-terminal cleavage/methylation domain-containing protein